MYARFVAPAANILNAYKMYFAMPLFNSNYLDLAMHSQTATHWYCLFTFLETFKSAKKYMLNIFFSLTETVKFENNIKDPINIYLDFFANNGSRIPSAIENLHHPRLNIHT